MTRMIAGHPMRVMDDSLPEAPSPVVAPAGPLSAASPVPPAEVDFAARLADLEGQVVAANEKVVNLEQALESNRRIGAAIGVVMAIQHVTERQAFDLLKRASQNRNCKLRTLADEVLLTGEVRARRRA